MREDDAGRENMLMMRAMLAFLVSAQQLALDAEANQQRSSTLQQQSRHDI